MGHDKFKGKSSEKSSERYLRTVERGWKRLKVEEAEIPSQKEAVEKVECPRSNELQESHSQNIVEVQTDLSSTDIVSLEAEMKKLTLENLRLQKDINNHDVTPEAFYGNDEKVKYLTGLPNYFILMAIFNLVSQSLSETGRSSLARFQQMMVVLMRLRLNLPVSFLSIWFHVSVSTLSRTYTNVVAVMFEKLKFIVHCPEKEELKKTMPMDFRKHFKTKVTIIIDCFEIFIERPSNLKDRAMTWSSYKHHNTVKYLIGIIPQGVISYISNGWGGRVSDKYLTEHSDFLQKHLPGDLVTADRGFDIADSLGTVGAQLVIPAFTRGKSKLSEMEVEKTRRIANVRIHAERVIGMLRQKYTYFDGIIPVDHLICPSGDIPVLDKEVVICCALVNLNESVVPFN